MNQPHSLLTPWQRWQRPVLALRPVFLNGQTRQNLQTHSVLRTKNGQMHTLLRAPVGKKQHYKQKQKQLLPCQIHQTQLRRLQVVRKDHKRPVGLLVLRSHMVVLRNRRQELLLVLRSLRRLQS